MGIVNCFVTTLVIVAASSPSFIAFYIATKFAFEYGLIYADGWLNDNWHHLEKFPKPPLIQAFFNFSMPAKIRNHHEQKQKKDADCGQHDGRNNKKLQKSSGKQ